MTRKNAAHDHRRQRRTAGRGRAERRPAREWMPFCAIRVRGGIHCLAEGAGCGCGQCGYGENPEPAASDGAQEHAAPQETERVSLPEFPAEIQSPGPGSLPGAGLCISPGDGWNVHAAYAPGGAAACVGESCGECRALHAEGGAVTLESHGEARPDGAGRAVFTVRGHRAGLYARGACQKACSRCTRAKKPPARRPYGSGPDVCRRCRQASRRRAGASQCGRRRSGGRAFTVGMTQTLLCKEPLAPAAAGVGGE